MCKKIHQHANIFLSLSYQDAKFAQKDSILLYFASKRVFMSRNCMVHPTSADQKPQAKISHDAAHFRDPKECVPPVRPKSAGYVIYAGCLAFILPTIILSSLYVAIAVRYVKIYVGCLAFIIPPPSIYVVATMRYLWG